MIQVSYIFVFLVKEKQLLISRVNELEIQVDICKEEISKLGDEILDKILEDKELIPAVIEAWNKADLLSEAEFNSAQEDAENIFKKTGMKSVLISAENGQGLDELFQAVENELAVGSKEGYIKITPIDGKIRSWLYEKGAILNEYPLEDGDVVLKVILNKINHAKFMAQFHEFVELDFATLRKLGINP